MLILGLVETALELIPAEITEHPVIVAAAKSRGKRLNQLLLDEAVHQAALKQIPDAEKRGRPDILHRSLLIALDSVLAHENQLTPFVHTYHDHIIEINPQTRLPRRYARFVGLMEQLFIAKQVPPKGEPLMRLSTTNLTEYVQQLNPSRTFLLAQEGTPTAPPDFAHSLATEPRPLVMVGGFAHGTFAQPTQQLADEVVSLDPTPLTTSTIVGMVLHSYENHLNLALQRFQQKPGSAKP